MYLHWMLLSGKCPQISIFSLAVEKPPIVPLLFSDF